MTRIALSIVIALFAVACADESEPTSGTPRLTPNPEPEAQPDPEPTPDPQPTMPDPDPAPQPDPDPAMQPDPDPEPQPDPEPTPNPEPQPDPEPPAEIWQPAPGTRWQWQLTETIDASFDVDMYDIDLFDTPQRTIDLLKDDGRVVICYFSAGSYEEWRDDARDFDRAALGSPLDGWPGERWLDIRADSVRQVALARLNLAAQKGCDGVEPDNIDGYTNGTGFPLTANDQLTYNRFLAREAHARGLSIGLKNDVDQVTQLVDDFDWALNEECFEYDECDTLLPFINQGKAVFSVEYGRASLADRICGRANALDFDTLIKNYDLDAFRVSCR